MAKFRCGIADDLVTSVLLAANKPIMVFPSMNDVMYGKPATEENMKTLAAWGVDVVKPDSGRLACGTEGPGRLPSTEAIVEYIRYKLYDKKELSGKKVLIDAGGTSEQLDNARCISNRSSGRMGLSLAREAFFRGAGVTLVTAGDVIPAIRQIKTVKVRTTKEMYDAMADGFGEYDVVVFAAAVSDFIPEEAVSGKIKKSDELVVRLIKNLDIAEKFSMIKKEDQAFIGFCAETEDIVRRAEEKMKRKRFDIIFANDISDGDKVFGNENNAGIIICRDGRTVNVPEKSKDEIASDIFDELSRI
jgi:phosphopantothenoylcysteine decarboxylase/phosphopantothenate--cysteine ligase